MLTNLMHNDPHVSRRRCLHARRHRRSRPGVLCLTGSLFVSLLLWLSITSFDKPALGRNTDDQAPEARPAGTSPVPVLKIVAYQPGVRIDWARRQVELDAKVVLRQGLIELFACSPRTREYESIVCIQARPLHAYQAMGLLGLVPGHPLSLDPATGRLEQATGQPLEIDIRYSAAGSVRTQPIENWLQRADGDGSLGRLDWVFAGSLATRSGGIAADSEGTVIAVVDFDSALIALPEHHTDSNAAIWLKPNTDRIPPVGTPCTLIVRSAPVRLHVEASGRLHLNGQPSTLASAASAIRQAGSAGGHRRIEIAFDPRVPSANKQIIRQLLQNLQVPAREVTFHPAVNPSVLTHDPKALAHWFNRRFGRKQPRQERGELQHIPDQAKATLSWTDAVRLWADDLRNESVQFRTQVQKIAQYIALTWNDAHRTANPQSAPTHRSINTSHAR